MRFKIIFLLSVMLFITPMPASAGDIDSSGPPLSGSGMYTIEDIYHYLIDGTVPVISSAFREPIAGPGPTMKSTKDIYDETKAKFDSCDATPDKVMDTVTFFSTDSGNWGPRSGSLTTKTLSGATNIVEPGYYEAASLNAIDPDLATGNIRSGVTIFGIEGDPNVVDTSSGNATHSDILSGKKAWVDGSQVIGTFACPECPTCPDAPTGNAQVSDVLTGKTFSNASSTGLTGTMTNNGAGGTITPGTTDQTVAAGYWSSANTVSGDADLVTGNIKSGVNIFGVDGTYTCPPACTGNAVEGDVLSGKTFSNASSTGLTGTMPNQGAINITPSTTGQSIAAGYHNGSGVVYGDADLVTGNIRSGANIFGVAGDPNVVDSSSGDAAAGDILQGKKAWIDGSEVTGNRHGGCTCTGTLHGTRWCDNGDGTVTDLITCLVWLQKADWGGSKSWREVGDYEQNDDAHTRAGLLKAGSTGADLSDGSSVGDWRLPTKNELCGLGYGTEAIQSDSPGPFTGVQSSYYWSSTTGEGIPNHAYAWYVKLDGSGDITGGGKWLAHYVWPVRSGN